MISNDPSNFLPFWRNEIRWGAYLHTENFPNLRGDKLLNVTPQWPLEWEHNVWLLNYRLTIRALNQTIYLILCKISYYAWLPGSPRSHIQWGMMATHLYLAWFPVKLDQTPWRGCCLPAPIGSKEAVWMHDPKTSNRQNWKQIVCNIGTKIRCKVTRKPDTRWHII